MDAKSVNEKKWGRWVKVWAGGVGAVLALGVFAGCNLVPQPTTDPTRYFVLAAPMGESDGATAVAAEPGAMTVGLSKVRVADYLDKQSLVLRTAANEVEYRPYDLWAESLPVGLARVIAERLAASPKIGRVLREPYALMTPRAYDARVTVERCEGDTTTGGIPTVKLVATIEITRGGGDHALVKRERFVSDDITWESDDGENLASAMSRAAAELGDAVAGALVEGVRE